MCRNVLCWHAAGMALINLIVAGVLTTLCVVNVMFENANLIVAMAGPLAAVFFLVLAAVWSIQALVHRGTEPAARRVLPRRVVGTRLQILKGGQAGFGA